VNDAWISGFRPAHMKGARWVAPSLSNVVVVSVAGGARDYQVRSRMASLDGLVPPTNGLTIGSSGMVNVFLSMEHQSILWCNQMAVQVAHTLLQLIDGDTGQQIKSPQRRMAVFVSNLRSALPQTFDWLLTSDTTAAISLSSKAGSHVRRDVRRLDDDDEEELDQEIGGDTAKTESQEAPKMDQFACPTSVHWDGETPGTDLYIDSTTMTVLAMDGRRRWLDIEKLVCTLLHSIFPALIWKGDKRIGRTLAHKCFR
jgi:glycosylphosphatidylinositol deacylase